ncbi:MAG TPA: hypothetical protein V6C89_21640 [Drouetiella sp.]
MMKYHSEFVPERLFLISTVKAVPLNKEFLSMLEAAGVRVICGSKRNRLSQLVGLYSEAGTEIVGCASASDIQLVQATLKQHGVIIACGTIVKTWCTQETSIDQGNYFFSPNQVDGRRFARLQEKIGGR